MLTDRDGRVWIEHIVNKTVEQTVATRMEKLVISLCNNLKKKSIKTDLDLPTPDSPMIKILSTPRMSSSMLTQDFLDVLVFD